MTDLLFPRPADSYRMEPFLFLFFFPLRLLTAVCVCEGKEEQTPAFQWNKKKEERRRRVLNEWEVTEENVDSRTIATVGPQNHQSNTHTHRISHQKKMKDLWELCCRQIYIFLMTCTYYCGQRRLIILFSFDAMRYASVIIKSLTPRCRRCRRTRISGNDVDTFPRAVRHTSLNISHALDDGDVIS